MKKTALLAAVAVLGATALAAPPAFAQRNREWRGGAQEQNGGEERSRHGGGERRSEELAGPPQQQAAPPPQQQQQMRQQQQSAEPYGRRDPGDQTQQSWRGRGDPGNREWSGHGREGAAPSSGDRGRDNNDGRGQWNGDDRRRGDWNGRDRSNHGNWDGRSRDYSRGWDRDIRRDDHRYDRWRNTHRDFDRPRYRDWRSVRYGFYFDWGYARIVSSYWGHDYYWWGYDGWRRPYRDWRVGYVLPPYVWWDPVPWDLYWRLPPPPYGCRYIMVDDDILLIAMDTGVVLDALMYY